MAHFSVKEVADALEVSYATALQYTKKYIPGAIRRGGRWFVPEEALKEFIDSGNPHETEEKDE